MAAENPSVTTDATFLKDAERLRFAMNAAGIGVWELDVDSNAVVWDDRCRALFGLAQDNVLPYEDAIRYIHPDDVVGVNAAVQAALRGDDDGRYDATYRTLGADDGVLRWVRFSGAAYRDATGTLTRFGGIAQDVTDVMAAQEREAESRQQLLALFEQSPVALATLSREALTFTSANAFYCELVNRRPDELIGRPLMEALPELEGQGFDALLNGVLDTGVPFIADEVAVDLLRDGVLSTLYVNLAYQPIRAADGTIPALLAVVVDVTSQVRARKAVEENEAARRLLVNSVPAMIFYLDAEERYTSFNDTFLQWYHVEEDAVLGKTVREFIGDEAYARMAPSLARAYAGAPVQYEVPAPPRMDPDWWLRITYTPQKDTGGRVTGLIVHATNITESKKMELDLRDSEAKFRTLIEQAPVAIGIFRGEDLIVDMPNAAFIEVVGKGPDIAGRPLSEVMPELAGEGQPFLDILRNIYANGESFQADAAPVKISRTGVLEERYFNVTFSPLQDANGSIYGILDISIDVTGQVKAQRAVAESEAKFRSLIEEAPVATCVFVGKGQHVIEVANAPMLALWGKGPSAIGKPLHDAVPELIGQPFSDILDRIYETGVPVRGTDAPALLEVDGVWSTYYFNFTYQPLFDENGQVYAIMDMAVDVTEQVLARQALEQSEAKLRSIVTTAPIAIGLFMGRDLVIENPNQTFIDIVGKGWGVVGKPLREAMPELVAEGQPFLQILDDVYTTGVPFLSPASLVKIVQNGVMTDRYYNISYSPVYNEKGEIYAILDVALDVTDQILAQQKIEAGEQALANAIDMAELGTWTIDLLEGKVFYADRVADWFGLPSGSSVEALFRVVPAQDAADLQVAIAAACAPDSDNILDVEHSVINEATGRRRIIHSKGQVTRDASGAAVAISGTGQDVTLQKNQQLALEAEVQERTEELAASYEEMQAQTEELAEANAKLVHSNEELAQYAYVASHDLQEPLRKIQVFTDMLGKRAELSDSSRELAGKVSGSASRMSLLIKDLLEFSRVLNSEAMFRPVSLDEIAGAVFNDYELVAAEKGALLTRDALPVVEAVPLQMNQVFQNLISNALKFTRPGVVPEIRLSCERLDAAAVAQYIPAPLPFATYYRICVRDNGIGFEAQYAEQIFEVFKRLHNREAFPGSGIGLALCRRIVTNHGGALYTESAPGEGSTFCLILPDKQTNVPSALPAGFTWKNLS